MGWIYLSIPKLQRATLTGMRLVIHARVKVNTLRLRQNVSHFSDDILRLIVLNENVWISMKIMTICSLHDCSNASGATIY